MKYKSENKEIHKLQNKGVIPLGGDYLQHLQNIPESYGGQLNPSSITEPLPEKFNGSQEAARRYAEGYQWGKENVRNPRENVAPYVGGGLAITAAAPFLIDAGAITLTNPLVRRVIDVAGNIDGIRNLISSNGISKTIRKIKEHDTLGALKSGLGDTFDLFGFGDTLRLASKIASPAYRGYHAFNTVLPYSYSNISKRAKDWVKSMLLETEYVNPTWFNSPDESKYLESFADLGENVSDFTKKARRDAFAIYTGQTPRHNMYTKNLDGTYSYNMDKLKEAYENNKNFGMLLDLTKNQKYDFIGGTHGGLWRADDYIKEIPRGDLEIKRNAGVLRIEDMWDLNPFNDQLISERLKDRLMSRFNFDSAVGTVGRKMLDSKTFGKIDNLTKNIEFGKIIGGKPFFMSTDIPYTSSYRINTSPISANDLFKIETSFGYTPASNTLNVKPFDSVDKFNFQTSYPLTDVLNNITTPSKIKFKKGGIIKGQDGIPELEGGQIATSIITPRGNYTKYTGEEKEKPSKEQFIDSKREESRINAVYNMLGASKPAVPIIPSRSLPSRIAALFGMSDEERLKRYGPCRNPYTCIYHATYTGYGPENAVVSNIDFMKNREKYGWEKVEGGLKEAKPGDGIQFISEQTLQPDHFAIVTGNNKEGMPTVTYSRGSTNAIHEDGETNMIYDNDRWTNNVEHSLKDGYGDWTVYRFNGNDHNIINWLKEYDKLFNSK